MSLGERVPKLRFPGFEGEWEETKIGDLLTIYHGRDYKHLSSGNIPVLGTGGIITYVDTALCNWSCTLIGRKGTIDKPQYMDQPFWSVDTLFYTKPKSDHNPLWQYYLFHTIPWKRYDDSTGVPSLSASTISSISVRIPKISEQKIQANFFSLLDSRIAAQRKLVELLKKHKRGVIEQIFRQHLELGNNSEKWNVVELRNLFSKVVRRNKDGRVKNVITNSAEFGLIPQRDFFDKSIAVEGNTDGYYIIHTGDFVYNPRKSTTAPFGPFNRYTGSEDGIISPLYTCLVPNEKADPEYLAWYFRSTAWHRYVYDNGSQGARHDRVNMTDDLLLGIPVLLPPIAVQEKIAKCLNAIDARWSSANKALAYLEDMKRGLLQQLFV